jgi:hypothetical protein
MLVHVGTCSSCVFSSLRCMGRLRMASLVETKVLVEVEEVWTGKGLGEDVGDIVARLHPYHIHLAVCYKFMD